MGPKPEIPGQQQWNEAELFETKITPSTSDIEVPTDTKPPAIETKPESSEVLGSDQEIDTRELYNQLKTPFKDPFSSKPRETTLLEIFERDMSQGHELLRDKNIDHLQAITSIVRHRFGSGERHEDAHSLAKIRALGTTFQTTYLEEIPKAITQLGKEQAELDLEVYNPRASARNIEIIARVKELEADQRARERMSYLFQGYFKKLAEELEYKAQG